MLLKKLFQTILNSKSSVKTQPSNVKILYIFYVSWNETFLMKSYMINCILLVLLLLIFMVLLKCTNSPLVIHFLNFVLLFCLYIGTFNYNLTRFLCDLLSPLVLHGYSCKDTFSFVSFLTKKSCFLRCN